MARPDQQMAKALAWVASCYYSCGPESYLLCEVRKLLITLMAKSGMGVMCPNQESDWFTLEARSMMISNSSGVRSL